MKKIKGVKGVLDGIRAIGSGSQQSRLEIEFDETLKSDNFRLSKIVRHGFPASPSCIAFDPIQKLLAIGTKHGSIRILGRAGVDCHIKLEKEEAVKNLFFVINEGKLISIGCDNTVSQWSIHSKQPEITQQMQFNKREDITCTYLPFQSKYLYIGTNKGNVYMLNSETFTLSGYIINWNKVIPMLQGVHPGSVIHLSESPVDPSKLLIGFTLGLIVLWDLKNKEALRFKHTDNLCSVSWHFEGRQFISSHLDGSLAKWSLKSPQKPMELVYPHANLLESPDAVSAFRCIPHVCWLTNKQGEDLFLFSGGSPLEVSQPCVNVLVGRHIDVLQMEHSIIDIIPLCDSPYKNDSTEPYAVAVLQQSDLVVIDLTSEGYPNFENPYPMDLHESPVTSCLYLADCPTHLIRDYYSIGRSLKRSEGFSTKQWPITGGDWGDSKTSYPEILITGHSDGSLKFWDASLLELQVLYRVRTGRYFEPPVTNLGPTGARQSCRQASTDSRDGQASEGQAKSSLNAHVLPVNTEEDPLAIHHIAFDPDYQHLVVSGSSHVCLLNFNKKEISSEINTLDVCIESYEDSENQEDFSKASSHPSFLPQQRESVGSPSQFSCSPIERDLFVALGVRTGVRRWAPGFQPELICRLGSSTQDAASPVTVARYNSSYQILTIGNDCGVAIIDTAQLAVLLCMCTQELYGSMDPYLRNPRSPTSKKEDSRSGSAEQLHQHVPGVRNSDCPGRKEPPPRPPPPKQLTQAAVESADADKLSVSLKKSQLLVQQKKCKLNPNSWSLHLPRDNYPSFDACPSTQVITETKVDKFDSLNGTSCDIEVALRNGAAFTCISRGDLVSIEVATEATEAQDNHQEVFHSPSLPATASSKKEDLRRGSEAADGDSCVEYLLDLQNDDLPCRKHFPVRVRAVPRSKSSHSVHDKADPSLSSRSCSSSTSSLDHSHKEGITFIAYADTYTRKNEFASSPCLWVGTSHGSVMLLTLQIPFDCRTTQPVICSPSPTMFRLTGTIKKIAFLDSIIVPPPPGDSSGAVTPETEKPSRKLGKSSSSSSSREPMSRQSTVSSISEGRADSSDAQLVCLCSEKQVRVLGLPSQTCYAKKKLTETSAVIRADVPMVQDAPCLICYLANGHVIVNSLPSLRPLMDVDYLPFVDFRISRTFQFSNHGHAIYFCSPSEVQKITLSSDMSNQLLDMLADLYITCKLPEPPKKTFLDKIGQNLFGAGGGEIDREQLFGESAAGKPSAGIASKTKGPDLAKLQGKVQASSSEIGNALQAGLERGEKLSEVDDQTERMKNAAEQQRTLANQLMQKYKDKDKKFWLF